MSIIFSILLLLMGIPTAHADVLLEQMAHGGTKTYDPGTFAIFNPQQYAGPEKVVSGLYLALHLVNFTGGTTAGQIDFNFSAGTQGNYPDSCWYVGTSTDCVDPATVAPAADLSIVDYMPWGTIYVIPNVNWGIKVTAPYAFWTDVPGGTPWGCLATTLEEAQNCPVPVSLASLAQNQSDGATIIAEGALTTEKTITFSAIPQATPGDLLELQVEVESVTSTFTGNPSATGAAVPAGQTATTFVADLTDGDYHWAARALDLTTGISTSWQEFGAPNNIDFSIDAHATLFHQTDDSAQSGGSWYGDNWYQLGRGFAGTITSLTVEGAVDDSRHFASHLSLKEFSDAGYSHLTNTYTISDDAPFTYGTFTKATFSDLNIPLDPNKYYRLDTLQEYQNRSVILKGTPGMGIAMLDNFTYGVGRTEGRYAFYPYIVASGEFLEPVVIVPGVMGSSLASVSTGKEIWPDVTDMANSDSDNYLDVLRLSSSGTELAGNEMSTIDIIRTAAGTYNRLLIPIPFSETIYKDLIDSFTAIGYEEGKNLFAVPYDWRFDIADSASVVGTVIRNAVAHSPNGKINIIAHSIGGLAVKKYLASAAAAGFPTGASFIDKLIFTGTPQLGAPFILKALEYGDDLGFGVGPFNLLNPEEVKSIVQNMPGIYELLPSRRYFDVEGSYVFDERDGSTQALSFDETNQFLTSDPADSRNPALLAAADAFHAVMDGATTAAPAVYNIVGCGNPTPTSYILGEDGSVDIERGNGDGSVPVDSAMNLADGYQNYFMLNSENGVDHTGLIRAPQSLTLIHAIIQGETSTLALTTLGASTSSVDCVQGRSAPRPAMIEVSVHGSSTLDVYDSAGNHMGPNAAGDIEIAVPGSTYDAIGDNQFVTLPASSSYRVKIKTSRPAKPSSGSASSTAPSSATITGTTVKVKTYDAAVHMTHVTTYAQIPLASPSSTATLVLASSSPDNPILSVDPDGNGSTSMVIVPTVLVSSSTLPTSPLLEFHACIKH